MKIIKKNGSLNEFDIDKIRTSLENSAKDIDVEITEADLKLILKQIEKNVQSLNGIARVTSTYEIKGLTHKVLKENGFIPLCKSYLGL